jgi:hypothetical protein
VLILHLFGGDIMPIAYALASAFFSGIWLVYSILSAVFELADINLTSVDLG